MFSVRALRKCRAQDRVVLESSTRKDVVCVSKKMQGDGGPSSSFMAAKSAETILLNAVRLSTIVRGRTFRVCRHCKTKKLMGGSKVDVSGHSWLEACALGVL